MRDLGRRLRGAWSDPGLRSVLAVLAGSRSALVLASLYAILALPVNVYNQEHNQALVVPSSGSEDAQVTSPPADPRTFVSRYEEPRPIACWARWDALWYLRIAEFGYASPPSERAPEHRPAPPASGFFPLMPVAMAFVTPFAGSPLRAGLLIANLALLAAVVLLYRLTASLLGRQEAVVTCTLLLVYPGSLFLSVPYAESLSLLLSVGSLAALFAGRYGRAGALGFLAALARPTGVLLAVPIALQWLLARRRNRGEDAEPGIAAPGWGSLTAAVLPALGLGLFLLFCWLQWDQPLAPIVRQSWWRGGLSVWPPGALHDVLGGPLTLLGYRRSWTDLVTALVFLGLGAAAFRYLPLPVAAFGLLATILPLGSSLVSFSRLALAAFPAFMTAGAILGRREAATRGVTTALAMLLGVFTLLYLTWNWLG